MYSTLSTLAASVCLNTGTIFGAEFHVFDGYDEKEVYTSPQPDLMQF